MVFSFPYVVALTCQRHEKTHHANMVGLRRAFVVRVLYACEELNDASFLSFAEDAS